MTNAGQAPAAPQGVCLAYADAAELEARAASVRRELCDWARVPASAVRVVRSPYRVCPLGAHVDHQLGEVTGMALDRALLMAFADRDDGLVVVRSRQFDGTVEIRLDVPPGRRSGDWADYARGAVHALSKRYPITRGMTALVAGHDNVAGLSSSAAAGVAYLLALEAVNGLEVLPAENVELDRVIENDYIGLENGILDQSVILLGRPGHLVHVDCLTGQSTAAPLGAGQDVCVMVLFSGLRAPLAETGYNLRVRECREAAALLLKEVGMSVPGRPYLRAVSPEAFARHGRRLPDRLRRRAAHFFGEQERVCKAVGLWRAGRLDELGRLVTESGRSSIENYECGNLYLRTAYEALCEAPGVYGARFAGGGFRGCCIALLRPESRQEAGRAALARYLRAHPDMEGAAQVYFCRLGSGASIID